MVNLTPEDFLFGLKVTDTITIKKFPKLDRFGEQAGKPNANFLNAELFAKAFLKPCEGGEFINRAVEERTRRLVEPND